jgi:hypothetical protein
MAKRIDLATVREEAAVIRELEAARHSLRHGDVAKRA